MNNFYSISDIGKLKRLNWKFETPTQHRPLIWKLMLGKYNNFKYQISQILYVTLIFLRSPLISVPLPPNNLQY